MSTLTDILNEKKVYPDDVLKLEAMEAWFSQLGLTSGEVEQVDLGNLFLTGKTDTNADGFSIGYKVSLDKPFIAEGHQESHTPLSWVEMNIRREGIGFIDFKYSDDEGYANIVLHLRYENDNAYMSRVVSRIKLQGVGSADVKLPENIPIERAPADLGDASMDLVGRIQDKVTKLFLLGEGWNKVYDKHFESAGEEYDAFALSLSKGVREITHFVYTLSKGEDSVSYVVLKRAKNGELDYRVVKIDKRQYEARKGFDAETAYSKDTIASLDNRFKGVEVATFDERCESYKRQTDSDETKKAFDGMLILLKLATKAGLKCDNRNVRYAMGLKAADRIIRDYDEARARVEEFRTKIHKGEVNIKEEIKDPLLFSYLTNQYELKGVDVKLKVQATGK